MVLKIKINGYICFIVCKLIALLLSFVDTKITSSFTKRSSSDSLRLESTLCDITFRVSRNLSPLTEERMRNGNSSQTQSSSCYRRANERRQWAVLFK